jgi:AcrR family transcriptional regulator
MPKVEQILRRAPKQDRSRERVDEILAVAKRLIGEKGTDAVKMREIAAQAGGPISSVYQYFPNKSAIVATLHNRWSNNVYGILEECLKGVDSLETLFIASAAALRLYHQRLLSDPAIVDVLSAVQADKTLSAAYVQAIRKLAHLFCETARPWIDPRRFDMFSRQMFLMFELARGVVRLALAVGDPEADGMMTDCKSIIYTLLMNYACPA